MTAEASENIEKLVSILLNFSPEQMAEFVAGAREIITQYALKDRPRAPTARQHPRRDEHLLTHNRQSALSGALFPFMGLQKWS